MAFGQQMITSGTSYTLLRKLNLLEDRSLNLIQKDSLEVVRSRAWEIMQQQYEDNEQLYIDFLGPYPRSRNGNIGIFIVLDHLSKFVFLQPVKKITADRQSCFTFLAFRRL